MRKHKRMLAILTAAGILAAGFPHELAQYRKTAGAKQSVLQFADALDRNSKPCNSGQLFSELRFSPSEQQIYRDGKAAGKQFGGFIVQNGRLMVDTAAAGIEGGGYVTPEQAAELIGCEVYGKDGDTVVTSPFQSGTLIVKAESLPDTRGAMSCTEGYRSLHVLQYDSPADAFAAYQAYSADSSVEYVQPNRILHICDEEEYPAEDEQDFWGLDAIGPEEYLNELNNRGGQLPEIKVAVIDTGIYPDHVMLKDRIAEGGASFVRENGGSFRDNHGHGTHCAGIVSMVTNDNVKILPLKVLSDEGSGETLDIYCAMMYAAEQNADVVSMSLGGLGESPLMDEASEVLAQAGIPLAVAAGNETMDAKYAHPANYAKNITVSAIEQSFDGYMLADYSNYGEIIDFSAPGSSILSAGISSEDEMVYLSGTSMATPFVAGVIASVLDFDPSLTVDEVYETLRINALDLGDEGFDTQFGWGMVQMKDMKILGFDGCEKPEASLPSGTYFGRQSVMLNCATDGAKIYYTLDGSKPDPETGILYDGSELTIDKDTIISAVAVSESGISMTAYISYQIKSTVPVPNIRPSTYEEAPLKIKLRADYADAIYYTLDGSDPGDGIGTLYSQYVTLPETCVLKAVSVTNGIVSDIFSGEYCFGKDSWLKFCEIENGILKSYSGTRTFLDFTELPEDIRITGIADGVFQGNTELESVRLPNTVTLIGAHAFEGCSKLESITADGLISVGDSAFSGCISLEYPKISWDTIESVGAYAFYRVPMEYAGDICSMNNLKELGAYAFSMAGNLSSFQFSDTLTEIPEGAFEGASFLMLKFGTVRKIGAGAFAAADSFGGCALYGDFSALTELPEHAFSNCRIYDEDHGNFNSVTKAEKIAFDNITIDTLYLTSLKEVPEEFINASYLMQLNLQSAETIADNAIRGNVQSVITGEALREMADHAIAVTPSFEYLAGSADSPAKAFAEKNRVRYVTSPAVLFYSDEIYLNQYDNFSIEPVVLGCDSTPEWRQFADETCSEQISGKFRQEDGNLYPDTTQESISYYAAGIITDGKWTRISDVVMVQVKPANISGELPSDGSVYVIDWFQTETLPVDNEEYSVPRTIFSYTADHDGIYYVEVANIMCADLFHTETGEVVSYSTSDDYIAEQPFTKLKKGETVVIAVSGQSSGCRYSSIQIREEEPEYNLSDCEFPYLIEEIFEFDGSPVTPDVPLTNTLDGTAVTLEKDKDYMLFYDGNDQSGFFSIYVFGIGKYSGALLVSARSACELSTNSQTLISPLGYQEQLFRLVPDRTTDYEIVTLYTQDQINTALQEDNGIALKSLDTKLTLYDKNLEYITDADDGSESYLAVLETELEKGNVYYLGISGYMPKNGQTLLSIEPAVSKKKLSYAYYDEYPVFTGEPVTSDPHVTGNNGEELTEGKDYEVYYFDNRMPGMMYTLIYGIGDYTGVLWRLTDLEYDFTESETTYTNQGEPFEQSGTAGIYRLFLPESATFTLEKLSGEDKDFRVSIFSYDDFWEIFDYVMTIRTPEEAAEGCYLSSGTYYLYILQNEEQTEFRWDTPTVYYDIENAFFTVDPLYETGSALSPVVHAYYDGEELTESKDFYVEIEEYPIKCGFYSLYVKGLGSFSGRTEVQYSVLPGKSTKLEQTETGTLTYSPESNALLEWTAESDMTCIWKDDLLNEIIIAYDHNMDMVGFIEGSGYQYAVFPTEPGETYYISACFYSKEQQGTFDYHLVSDFRLLTDCKTVYEKMLPYAGGEKVAPEFEIRDGDTILKEGQDYTVKSIGGEYHNGEAEILLYGCGDYIGTMFLEYYIYPDASVMDEMEAEELLLDEWSEEQVLDYPGTMHLYTFTAPKNAAYYPSLPNFRSNGVTTFIYDRNNQVLNLKTRKLMLEKGETVRFLCVTDFIENLYEPFDSFYIAVESEPITQYYYDDGFEWEVHDDQAILTDFPVNLTGVMIPDTFIDEDDELEAAFAGISEECAARLSEFCTVYCTPGGAVDLWCHEHGICCAYPEPSVTIAGDVTGDGVLDEADVRTLLRCMAELPGMVLSDAAFEMADMNGDGILTMNDAFAIMRIINSETAKN
ncbi:MAG: leucine-rich repeat protein [Oscillospiraceae bacterium]|nr:leucine-rich repeat protein [Oscillospiraceae bacterium]